MRAYENENRFNVTAVPEPYQLFRSEPPRPRLTRMRVFDPSATPDRVSSAEKKYNEYCFNTITGRFRLPAQELAMQSAEESKRLAHGRLRQASTRREHEAFDLLSNVPKAALGPGLSGQRPMLRTRAAPETASRPMPARTTANHSLYAYDLLAPDRDRPADSQVLDPRIRAGSRQAWVTSQGDAAKPHTRLVDSPACAPRPFDILSNTTADGTHSPLPAAAPGLPGMDRRSGGLYKPREPNYNILTGADFTTQRFALGGNR